MSKYKLIKKYPGSPELGTIAEKGMGIQFTHPNGKVTGVSYSGYYDFKTLIQDNPEFWEEVIEKDYEILSFVNNGSAGGEKGFIVPLQNDGLYYAKGYPKSNYKPTLYVCLELKFLNIHSVKRLSDGEIFTVGDKIKSYPGDRGFEIKYIWINDLDQIVLANYNKGDKGSRSAHLLSPQKVKQPLFTTEDGFDIYEGDKYYEVITPDFHNKSCIWNILEYESRPNIIYDQEGNRKNGRIWFSTIGKAKEYIIMNKPCLSIQDLLDTKGVYFEGESKLKELVKSKL